MKKYFPVVLMFITAVLAYSQGTPRLSTVGILPMAISGSGVSDGEAARATEMITSELDSWGTMTILPGDRANSAEYLIRGQISRQNNQIILTAATTEARTGRLLNNSKIETQALDAAAIESFCEQITENVPYPNYLLGRWQSTINMIDGPVTCIMEFRSDRSVRVTQFDTWEHNGKNSLKYQAIGSGTYTYAGYRRRTINVGGKAVQADATIGVNLTLEDALPKYSTVSRTGLRVLFDENTVNFELVNAGIPCGDNYSGPSVYPAESVSYTKFTKIQ